MVRRFSPFQLVYVFVVVVLWGALFWNRSSRELAFHHARAALAPRSFDYSLPFEPTERVDLQMVDAQQNQDQKRLGALVEANARDATLLAVYVRSSKVIPLPYKRQVGPLASASQAWSVEIAPPLSVGPDGLKAPGSVSSGQRPLVDTKQFLALMARGRKLEPQNSYWDWMEMAALVEAGRELQLDSVAHRAAQKAVFDDHSSDELRARIDYFNRQKLFFAPANTVAAFGGLVLPHLSVLTNVSRYLAQRVMGLRLQGRDDEALQLGLDGMRLARQVRLQGSTPITSLVGARNERLLIEKARVRLGPPVSFNPTTSPLTTVGSSPTTLLYLARAKSPNAAAEIGTEWQRIARWRVSSLSAFGGLVEKRTILQVGWTTRVASFFATSLPVALLVWGILVVIRRRVSRPQANDVVRLVCRGIVWTLAFFGAFLVVEWLPQKFAPELESWLALYPSLLTQSRLAWGGITLWLLWLALWRRPHPQSAMPQSQRRIEDWEESLVETLPIHVMDWGWRTLKWGTKAVLPLAIGMFFIGGVCLTLLDWPYDNGREPIGSQEHLLWLVVSLGLLPTLWVWLREGWHWLRRRQRLGAPGIFARRARLLLSGYLLVALVVLPVSIWAQSRFQRYFERQFAPIARGQMIVAMQKLRGLPMQ